MITKEQLAELASASERRDRFKDTFIEVLYNYHAPAKDVEMLAFIGCVLMTKDAHADKVNLERFLLRVYQHTQSVWQYIDEEMYMVDYAFDLRMLKLLMLLHEVILTTQTIEASLKISMQYNKHLTDFFWKLFGNAGMEDYVTPNKLDPHRGIYMFLSLMVRDEPVGLHLWGDWITPKDLQIPISFKEVRAARDIGIIKFADVVTAEKREMITAFFREVFPEDPVKGYFALLSYSDRRIL